LKKVSKIHWLSWKDTERIVSGVLDNSVGDEPDVLEIKDRIINLLGGITMNELDVLVGTMEELLQYLRDCIEKLAVLLGDPNMRPPAAPNKQPK